MRLGLNLNLQNYLIAGRGGGSSSAADMLVGEGDGLALAVFDDSMIIKDTGTPANDYLGKPQNKLSITRSGNAYRWGSTGLLALEAANTIRRDHDPVLFRARGYLIEPAATDLLTRTEEFDNAAWTKSEVTVTPNAAPDIYGTQLADKVIESANSAAHSIFRSVVWTNGVKYSVSVVLSAAELSKGSIFCNLGLVFEIRFDLVAGTITQTTGTGTIEYLGRGLYRVTAYGTAGATTSGNLQVRLVRTAGTYTYQGDGVSGLYVHAFKVTALGYETSYFPSVGSAATRNADAVTLATSLFPWADAGLLTITGRAPRGVGLTAKQVLWQCDDGSEGNRIRIERNTSKELHCIVSSGASDTADLNLGTLADYTDFAVSFGWDTDDFSASLNGALAVTDDNGDIPTGLTAMRLGSSFTGEHWGGWLSTLKYLPQ